MLTVRNVPRPRRHALGAEELIELGQASTPVAPSVAPPAMPAAVGVSPDEGRLLVATVEGIVAFAKDYPVEFHSYCPADRWEKAMAKVGTWAAEVESQIERGTRSIQVPADVVFYLIDLERCVSNARDARLSSARWAFTLSSAAAVASWALGVTWLGVPAYLAGLALLYGRPLYAKYQAEPQEPYKPILNGRHALAGCAPPEETPEEARQVKYLERVVVPVSGGMSHHYWGVLDSPGDTGRSERSTCLMKGRWRVRIEGWSGDRVMPAIGWRKVEICEPTALNVVGVTVAGETRGTPYGPLPEHSRHEEDFWVEYIGPMTGGKVRRAGPFGCPFDTRDHAVEDSGITHKGVDGDYEIFDGEGAPVDVGGPS